MATFVKKINFMRKTKIMALVIGLIAGAILILYGLSRALDLASPAKAAFYRYTDELVIGMAKDKVQALFGETPAYVCKLSESEVWYYAAPGRLTGTFPDNTPERGTLYRSTADLPDIYGHIQLAFDSNDELIAYTFIGESYTTEWRSGSVKGSHFKHLPPGAL